MNKFFITYTFVLLSILVHGQEEENLIIGKRFSIYSEILNSDREISIYLPASYDGNDYANYPVLYFLDGRKFFHSFSGVVAQLSSDASPQIPEMIVVGITSQDRIRDSSPTHSILGYSGQEESGYEVSGGADSFLNFIREELIPFIDNKYRTNTYRIFAGYSFTGLPVMHSLFKSPEAFDAYLVIDFSAWWDNEVTIKNAKTFLDSYIGPRKDFYITTVDRVSTTTNGEQRNSAWSFIKEFEKMVSEKIDFGYSKYLYREENHHSLPLISFMDGIKYIFRGHMVNFDEMYSYPSLLKKKFKKLSDRLGYEVFLSESLINFYAYQFLYGPHQDLDKAIFYFTYNTENYPQSSSTWARLGEAYQVKGDKKKAIYNYEKSLALNPESIETQNKLSEMKN